MRILLIANPVSGGDGTLSRQLTVSRGEVNLVFPGEQGKVQ